MVFVKGQLLSWAGRVFLWTFGLLPLVWMSGWRFGWELPKIVFLSAGLMSGAVLAFLEYGGGLGRRLSWKRLRFWWGWILFLALGSVASSDMEVAVWGFDRWQGLWFYLLLLIAYVLVGVVKNEKGWRDILGLVWLFGATGTVLVGWIVYIKKVLGFEVPVYDGRMVSSFGQPNFWSDYLLIGWAYVWWSGKYSRKVKMASLAVVMLGLVLSGSRLNWLVLAALVLLRLAGRLWLVALPAGMVMIEIFRRGWFDRRILIWQEAWGSILKQLWLGYGLDNLGRAGVLGGIGGILVDRAHNVVLDQFLFGGVGAGVMFLWLWGSGVVRAYKNGQREVLAGLLMWLVLACVHVVGVVNWLWLAILLGLVGRGGKLSLSKIEGVFVWGALLYGAFVGGLLVLNYGIWGW